MIEKLKAFAGHMTEIVDWINVATNIKTDSRRKIILVSLWNEYFTRLMVEMPTSYSKMIAYAYRSMISKKTTDTLEWEECYKLATKILLQISNTEEEEWF